MFRIEIADSEILQCRNATEALRMTLVRSGRTLYEVGFELGITESHLSRCLNTNDVVNLPNDKIVTFMTACGNAIYLRWLFLTMKGLLPELEHDDGACIASEVETLKLVLAEAIAQIKAARPRKKCGECGALYALTPADISIPRWLAAEALLIEREFGEVAA